MEDFFTPTWLSNKELRQLCFKADTLTGAMYQLPDPDAVRTAQKLLQRTAFPEFEPFDCLVSSLRLRRPSHVFTVLHGAALQQQSHQGAIGAQAEFPLADSSVTTPVGLACGHDTEPVHNLQLDSIARLKVKAFRIVARMRLAANNSTAVDCDHGSNSALADFTGLTEPPQSDAEETECSGSALAPEAQRDVLFLLPVEALRSTPCADTRVFISGNFLHEGVQLIEMRLDTSSTWGGEVSNVEDPAWFSAPAYRAVVRVVSGVLRYRFIVRLPPPSPEEWVVLPDSIAPQQYAADELLGRHDDLLLLPPPTRCNVMFVPLGPVRGDEREAVDATSTAHMLCHDNPMHPTRSSVMLTTNAEPDAHPGAGGRMLSNALAQSPALLHSTATSRAADKVAMDVGDPMLCAAVQSHRNLLRNRIAESASISRNIELASRRMNDRPQTRSLFHAVHGKGTRTKQSAGSRSPSSPIKAICATPPSMASASNVVKFTSINSLRMGPSPKASLPAISARFAGGRAKR